MTNTSSTLEVAPAQSIIANPQPQIKTQLQSQTQP